MADFFDNVIGRVNKGVADVSAKSKAAIEKTKINGIIRNLDNERKQLAEFLGMKVYNAAVQEQPFPQAEVDNYIAEITKRVQMIAEQQAQLQRIEAEVAMATGTGTGMCVCGYGNVPGAKFCARCGAQLQ